jgi:hypothetical protein
MVNFVIKNFVSKDDVKKMCDLDKTLYTPQNQVDLKICESWYDKNPRIYTAILLNDNLIGYINFMPITDECYEKFKSGKMPEQGITPSDMEVMEPNKSYYCLFSSVVIDKKYQNTPAFTFLISSFYRNMKKYLNDNNIKIKSIIADCVNKKMAEFVVNSGFKQIYKDNNYNIYEGNVFNK